MTMVTIVMVIEAMY